MLKIFTKLFSSKRPQEEPIDPDGIIAEKWEADFSHSEKIRFALTDSSSHRAFIEDKSLVLALKRQGCLAWLENPLHRYNNFVINADVRIDALGGYAAAGISFRMVDEVTNYTLLVSSKGYFRIDVIRNRNPLSLLGWTEIPVRDSHTKDTHVEIIAWGNHIIVILNGEWAAEFLDDTLSEGMIGFASASYSSVAGNIDRENPQVSKAYLDSFSIESRYEEVEARYVEWNDDEKKSPAIRLRLAETYFAMGDADETLTQLEFIWNQKDHSSSNKELLLAAKASLLLSRFDDAEKYLNAAQSPDANMSWDLGLEKARLLYQSKRYEDLQSHTTELLKNHPEDLTLLTLLGHAHWNLKDFPAAADAYEQAAKFDTESGLPAKNAGNAYDILGDEKKALACYLQAGRCFLKNDNYHDLEFIIPRLLYLAPSNWEVHALAGKFDFGIGDWQGAESEFEQAERLRLQGDTHPAEDPALVFLQGLILIQKGRRQEALSFLEKALALDDEHSVFHFKLAENRFMIFNNPNDEEMKKHLAIAQELSPDDGWIANMAARIALAAEDEKGAEHHVSKAEEMLGLIPAVRVNKALLLFQKGLHDEALETLEANRREDPDGMMANCAGNLLSKRNRHEDAESYYRKALSIDQDNPQYKINLASCLIQMGLYSEAETLLTSANDFSPSADALEMIAFIAVQKADYPRAEEALHSALKLEAHHIPAMISLGWIYANTFRWKECEDVLRKIEAIELDDASKERYIELEERCNEAVFKTVACFTCNQTWNVRKTEIDVPPIRLFSEPPDDLPAGTCPECGKTFCIGCAKSSIDDDGRFVCKDCGKNLKLMDSGLKKIISDWAAKAITEQSVPEKKTTRKRKNAKEE
ncbi:MAG: tetratricopeptide repeat protein [Treponema sp.]|nr:tetratricopeptide repeat protein [Treponema sp.]